MVEDLISKQAGLSAAGLQAVMEDPKSTMIQITVASILLRAAKDGDYARLQFLLDRAIGKVKDVSDVNVTNYESLSDIELVQLVKMQLPQLEKKVE